jgi:hypothetical protein
VFVIDTVVVDGRLEEMAVLLEPGGVNAAMQEETQCEAYHLGILSADDRGILKSPVASKILVY